MLNWESLRPSFSSLLGAGAGGVRRALGKPLLPLTPADPPEEVVGDLQVADCSLHEEAHQGAVQVALILQGLQKGQVWGTAGLACTPCHVPVPPHTWTSWGR